MTAGPRSVRSDHSGTAAKATPDASLLSKSIWSGLGTLSAYLPSFLGNILIARILGPEGMGQIAYLLFLTDTVALVSGLGLQSALTRFIAELRGRERAAEVAALKSWLFRRYLLRSTIAVLALISLTTWLERDSNAHQGWYLLPLLFFTRDTGAIYQAMLQGEQRVQRAAALTVIGSIVQLAGLSLGSWLFGVTGALLGYAMGSIIPAVLAFSMLRQPVQSATPDHTLTKRLWRYALETWVTLLVSAIIFGRLELYFLERSWGARSVAMYSVSLSIAVVVTQIPLMFTSAFMPHFAELAGASNTGAIQRAYASGTRLLALLLFPLCLCASATVPVVLPALYGARYVDAGPVARIIVASSALGFATVGASVCLALGRTRFLAISQTLGAALMLGLCYLLVPRMGCTGAALARATVQVVTIAAITGVYLPRGLKIKVPFRSLLGTGALSLAAAGICLLAMSVSRSMIGVLAGGLIAVAFYVAFLNLSKGIHRDDAVVLGRLLSRMPSRLRGAAQRCLGLNRYSGSAPCAAPTGAQR